MTEPKELKTLVREAADDAGINGVMELTELCTELTYERVSKVWQGNTYVLGRLAHRAG